MADGNEDTRWVLTTDAARLAHRHVRTIERLVASGRLPARTDDKGRTLVDARAAKALASGGGARKTAPSADDSGDAAAAAGGAGGVAARAKLAAEVFSRLESGARAVDLVAELGALPSDVSALYKEWKTLQAGDAASPNERRLTAFSDSWGLAMARFDERLSNVEDRVVEFAAAFSLINRQLAAQDATIRELWEVLAVQVRIPPPLPPPLKFS